MAKLFNVGGNERRSPLGVALPGWARTPRKDRVFSSLVPPLTLVEVATETRRGSCTRHI